MSGHSESHFSKGNVDEQNDENSRNVCTDYEACCRQYILPRDDQKSLWCCLTIFGRYLCCPVRHLLFCSPILIYIVACVLIIAFLLLWYPLIIASVFILVPVCFIFLTGFISCLACIGQICSRGKPKSYCMGQS